MYSVLFVCLGNICRSPMAEMIFKKLVKGIKAENIIQCESRATSTEEYGKPMYPKTVQTLQAHGVNVENHSVAMVKREDYYRYNYIVCMDKSNYYDLLSIFRGDPDKKVHLLNEFLGNEDEIEDPWYTGNFEKVYGEIEKGCTALFTFIIDDAKKKSIL